MNSDNHDGPQQVLVTGGTGYIGSHTCIVLAEAGYEPVIIDNLSNSSEEVLARLQQITGNKPAFVRGDIRDADCLRAVFERFNIQSVLHFAGLKAVGESVEFPERYQDNNVEGTRTLLAAMAEADVRTLVFSSSATVYGDAENCPISEDTPRSATSPYGQTKLDIENLLEELVTHDANWRVARLRYFNPVGAHKSGLIGEDPRGTPNNLVPYIAQVAVGRREILQVFGDDYDTIDGTGLRDYIHVVDLAEGHLAALRYLEDSPGMVTVNLGTGRGVSVLQMVRAFEAASGQKVPYEVIARRPGDIATSWADPGLAEQLMGWRANRTLEDMCRDTWRWQQSNPRGFEE